MKKSINKKKMLLRIISVVGALVIIVVILFFANLFVGNPINSAIAKMEIKKYVVVKYDKLDLNLSNVKYNAEYGYYYITATSKTKKDEYFTITYDKGNVSDSYADVESGANTLRRWQDEYKITLETLLSKEFGTTFKNCSIYFEKNNQNIEIIPSETFNSDVQCNKTAYISFIVTDSSAQSVSTIINNLNVILLKNDCNIENYCFTFIGNEGKDVLSIYNVKQNYINQDLEKIIFQLQEKNEKVSNDKETGIIYTLKSADSKK